MTVPFATSARSSVGLEWELMLADRDTGDLVGRAPEFLPELEERTELERYTVTGELLTNTIEVTSGIGDTVAAAVDDIADAQWQLGDACELSLLEAVHLESFDVVIAATGDDKANVVLSLLAKTEFAVPRVVARVNDPRNEWLFTDA